MLNSGQLYRHYQEIAGAAYRLGRNLWLDARSLAYMIESDVAAMLTPGQSVAWDRKIPILDQGQLGSCTGNAGVGALGTAPFFEQVGQDIPLLDEGYAVGLYGDATIVDGYPGSYPPDDLGSSGLAVCKVLRARRLIDGYRWASSPAGLVRLLQDGPVLMGMPWYQAFFDPSYDGSIDRDARWESSGLAGGHEVEIVGVDIDPHQFEQSTLTFANSWGPVWGDAGYGRMRLGTYQLLHEVDLKQYVIH